MAIDLLVVDSSTEPEGAPRVEFCGTLARTTCTVLEQARQVARNTGQPIVVAYSVRSMVDGILDQLQLAAPPATIGVLRIIGHGHPGSQAMGDSFTTSHPRQLIALDRHGLVLNRAVLARLRGYFNSASRVELHGCYVAEGPGGFALLQALHTLWGVPVSAGISEQNGGTVGLDGPKMTVGAIGRR